MRNALITIYVGKGDSALAETCFVIFSKVSFSC